MLSMSLVSRSSYKRSACFTTSFLRDLTFADLPKYEAVAIVDPSTLPASSAEGLCERKGRCDTAKTSTGTWRPSEDASKKARLVQAEPPDDDHTGVLLQDDRSLCRKESIEDTPDQTLAVNTNVGCEIQPLISVQPVSSNMLFTRFTVLALTLCCFPALALISVPWRIVARLKSLHHSVFL